MKTNLWLLAIFIFSIFSSINVQALDLEKDQQIISILTSDEFSNSLIDYEFEGNKYPLRLIYNPKKETLWGRHLSTPTSVSLMMIADVSIPLARHFEDIILELRGSYDDSYFSLKDEKPEKGWDSVRPVHIAESINDSINDEIMESSFHSTTFAHQVIYYHLKNRYYQVRILHNPEGRTFSATKKFRLEGRSLQEFSISWNKRYAIFVDEKAPKELINHLSASLKHLSYWNWYFNFSLENGTDVEYCEHFGDTTITYYLDSWFNYTENF